MTNVDRRRSYRPGGWFGIFGDHASVLLPPSEKHRVTSLWELIDDGAGFDEVLDGLLANGLRDLPGFVLVSDTPGLTKVVLRGAAVAAFVVDGDMVELAGSTDTTWVERSLTGVTQMFVQVEATDEDEGEDLLIENGLVRLGRVDQPPFRLDDADEADLPAAGASIDEADSGTGGSDADPLGLGVAAGVGAMGGFAGGKLLGPGPDDEAGLPDEPSPVGEAEAEAADEAAGEAEEAADEPQDVDETEDGDTEDGDTEDGDTDDGVGQDDVDEGAVEGEAAEGDDAAAEELPDDHDDLAGEPDERPEDSDVEQADVEEADGDAEDAGAEGMDEPGDEPGDQAGEEPTDDGADEPATEQEQPAPISWASPPEPEPAASEHDEPLAAEEPVGVDETPTEDAVEPPPWAPREQVQPDEPVQPDEVAAFEEPVEELPDEEPEAAEPAPWERAAEAAGAPAEPSVADLGHDEADDTVVDAPKIDAPMIDAPSVDVAGDEESSADQSADVRETLTDMPAAPSDEEVPDEQVGEQLPPPWQPAASNFGAPAPAYPVAGADPLGASAPADDDHDGLTRGGWEADPAPAAPAASTPASAGPVARLVFSSGESVDVDRPVLVGRAPEVRRFGAQDQPRLVPVPSPHQEISATHLEVRPGVGADHGSAVVTDLGSTNGTVLVQPGLPPEDLQPGIAVQLVPGAIIDLGDGVTIQVTRV